MVSEFLSQNGYLVEIESNGIVAAARLASEPFDVAVLDIGLPGMDGISVCRSVRLQFSGPILMLTARGDEIDEVVALDVGADDYLTKPVRPKALLARLRVHMRRSTDAPAMLTRTRITVDDLVIDASSRTVLLRGDSVELTTAEFDLLWLLAEHVGAVVDREIIYQQLHGVRYDGTDRSIDLRVSRLRKKLLDDPQIPKRVKSIRGVGYMLANPS